MENLRQHKTNKFFLDNTNQPNNHGGHKNSSLAKPLYHHPHPAHPPHSTAHTTANDAQSINLTIASTALKDPPPPNQPLNPPPHPSNATSPPRTPAHLRTVTAVELPLSYPHQHTPTQSICDHRQQRHYIHPRIKTYPSFEVAVGVETSVQVYGLRLRWPTNERRSNYHHGR